MEVDIMTSPNENELLPAATGGSGAVAGATRSFAKVLAQAIKSGVAGTFAGMAEETASYPLDLVKTRMQVHAESVSAIHVLRQTVKSDGVAGLFKGLPGPLVASAAVSGCVFGGYGSAIGSISPTPFHPALGHTLLAGAFAGFLQSFVTCPVDVVKNRMQVGQNTSTVQTFSQILRNRGVMGLYKGFGATLARDVPAYAAFFAAYESLKRLGANPDDESDFINVVFAGGVAGMVYHTSTYPIDVAKTRLQTQSDITPMYKGLWDCLKALKRSKSLFRGFWPTALRSFPSYAAGFVVYESILRFCTPHPLP
jgi:solute carrier family 25 carnitine/acylcarnitine transporter 20/29